MAEQHIKLNIGSNANLTGFEKVKGAISSIGSKIGNFAKTIGSNLMNIKAGFDMLSSSISKIGSLLSKSMDAESAHAQFKNYIKDTEQLADHMKMLQEMGDTPPFSMEEFEKASIALMRMSDGALGFQKSLTLVGDAAQATGQNLETVSDAVGRAYGIIRDGQPVSKAATQLRNLGLITPEVAKQLDDLQKSGASSVEVWDYLENSLSKYKGAMDLTLDTGNGLVGAIGSQWDDILREFGKTFLDILKGPLTNFLDFLKNLRNDESVIKWANKSASALGYVLDKVASIVNYFKDNNFDKAVKDLAKSGNPSKTYGEWERVDDFTRKRKVGDDSYEYETDTEAKEKFLREQRDANNEFLRKREMLDKKQASELEKLNAENAKIRQQEIEQKKSLEKDNEDADNEGYARQMLDMQREWNESAEKAEENAKKTLELEEKRKQDEQEKRDKEINALNQIVSELKDKGQQIANAIQQNANKQQQNIGAVGGGQRKFDRNQQLFQANQDAKANRRANAFNDRMDKLYDDWIEGGGKAFYDKEGNLTGFRSGKLNMSKRERENFQDWIRGNKLRQLARENDRKLKLAQQEKERRERENNRALIDIKNKFNQFITVQTAN